MTYALRLRDARGTAIPETALVVSIFLMIMYATIQYGVLGYEQVSADGATFVGAHDTVAMYGGPSSSNNSYTQKVISTIFNGLRTAQVTSIPNNGSYETDVSLSGVANQGLSSLLPTALQTTSRTVEASSSSAAASPVGNCALGATKILNGAGSQVTSGTVNLLQGTITSSNGLFGLAPATSGISASQVVNLNTGVISTQLALLTNVKTQFQATSALLAQLSALISVQQSIPLIGPLATQAGNLLSATIQPLLTAALTGTLTQASINQATATLQGSSSLLTQVFGTAISPILYGTAATPGLLSGGPNGGLLGLLNTAEAQVNNLDALAPTVCPSP